MDIVDEKRAILACFLGRDVKKRLRTRLADCRNAGLFVDEIGLDMREAVCRLGFQSILMRDGSLAHFRETRDERREGFSERFRTGDPAA